MKPSKTSYQLIGNPATELGFLGLSTGMKLAVVVSLIGFVGILAVTGPVIWTKVMQDRGLDQAHKDLVAVNISLGNKILDVNVSLCDKVMEVNTTLLSQLDVVVSTFDAALAGTNMTIQDQVAAINATLCTKIMEGDAALLQDILILNGTNVNTTLFSQLSMLNDSLCIKIMDGDALLQTELSTFNVTILTLLNSLNTSLMTKITNGDVLLQTEITSVNMTLTAGIASSLASVNNVSGQPGTRNVDLVANGTGIQVQPNVAGHSVYLENTGVVTVNSVTSLSGSHDLLVTGTGMITVNSFPLTSTIQVDGSALSTSISNLQMQNNMQQMEITILEGNVTTLQSQITNLQMAGDMITQSLNGTTVTFNMSIMTLMTEVMNLQSTVAALQAQVMSLSSGSVASGTISPFGGTIVPTGYLLCDGSQYLQSSYPALYTVIGTMYCGGTCSNMTVFKVPDLRGKIPVGQISTASAFNLAIGSVVGEETHILTAAEMPSHSHSGYTDVDGTHQHATINGPAYALDLFGPYTGQYSIEENGGTPNWHTDVIWYSGAHQHHFTTGGAGSGGAHNNIQPSLIVKYIIKT
jgi:microcystin-dependent protein